MKTDFEVGELIFIPEYGSLFAYSGRDDDKRFVFKLFALLDKTVKIVTNHIAFPEKHLTDPSYRVELMRIRHLKHRESAKRLIRDIFKK